MFSEESQATDKDAKRRSRAHGAGDEHVLPKASDLAESFLEAEPKEEKEELEAAISSRSAYLRNSPTSVSDEEEEFGLGDEYTSLPSFVARFIKGIGDRLSVTIKGISVRLDMELNQDGVSKRHPQEQADLVSGLLTIDGLSVGAALSPSHLSDEISSNEIGRRRVSFTDIGLSLVSDPVVFSNYSHFGRPSSPAMTMQSRSSYAGVFPNYSHFERPLSPAMTMRSRRSPSPSHSSPDSGNSEPDYEPSSGGDLSESRFYSHEEAQSMYMSAISHGPVASGSFMPEIPGGWRSAASSEGEAARAASEHPDVVEESEPDDTEQDRTGASTPKVADQPEPPYREQSESTSGTLDPLGAGIGKVALVKKFLEIDKFVIWLPPSESDEAVTGAEIEGHQGHGRSTSGNVKGSTMNMYDSTTGDDMFASRAYGSVRSRKESMIGSAQLAESIQPSLPHNPEDRALHELSNAPPDFVIEISTVVIQFDIATGWLVAKMGQKLMHSFGDNDGKGQSKEQQTLADPEQAVQNRAVYSLSLNKLFVNLVDHLAGCPFSLEGPNDLQSSSSPYDSALNNIFLKITSAGWKVHLSFADHTSNIRLDVTKFAFGFATEDIVSFDEGLKLQESTRDIMSPSPADISVIIEKTAHVSNVHLRTLPLHLNLRIQRLEEALNWFGGLSTIIEVGSSISSASTARGATSEPKRRPRGVRFETGSPPAASESQSSSTPWKVNVRIKGVVVDLIGEAQYKLTTSALKAVGRYGGIIVQVDNAKFTGPISLNGKDRSAPAWAILFNIRIEYLFSPKEVDLDRLLSLITPSKDKYDEDDDIMLDTLFRQRRQGAVFRATIGTVQTAIPSLETFESFSQLANELATLSTVTKYLPEDDRPGILTLALVKEFDGRIQVGGEVGSIDMRLRNLEAAHISIPSLVAARVSSMSVVRNEEEELVGDAEPEREHQGAGLASQPVLMARFIADEMDPTVKIKLFNLRVEYTVSAMIALLGIKNEVESGDAAVGMATSLANLGDLQSSQQGAATPLRRRSSAKSDRQSASMKSPKRISVLMQDCLVGLNPRDSPAKGIFVLTNARFSGFVDEQEPSEAVLELRKASLMVIDDARNAGYIDNLRRRNTAVARGGQLQALVEMGYVPVTTISSAMAAVKVIPVEDNTKSLDVELRDDLLILETCADSTQTLISLLNGLQPPAPPRTTEIYRTQLTTLPEMLQQSFSGDAYATDAPENRALEPIAESESILGTEKGLGDDYDDDDIDYVSDFRPTTGSESGMLGDFVGALDAGPSASVESFQSQYHVSSSVSELDFRDDHFSKQSAVGGTAHRWDSHHNTYELSNESKVQRSPLRVRVRDVHVIWNLFDGYDWQRTRDAIAKLANDMEAKATERRSRAANRASPSPESDDEPPFVGDFLFNSIYIEVPKNRDPRELNQLINNEIDEMATETGSYATSSTVTATQSRRGGAGGGSPSRRKKLRLSRSKRHKMTFELKGVSADYVVFPPDSGETQTSLDVRVNDLEIFDHVPTSTWRKFATYMREAGEKESGTSMVHLEVLTVKPVPELAAAEIVLKAAILPLRLHVDQDALDFMSRFFEFRDEGSKPSTRSGPGEKPFLQRVEVHDVPVKLDFKPKRVDYGGLRSGRTTEFMNFFVLDEANMILRHVIVYGISGFDKLGQTLNDIWMPDIKRTQLPDVLAGLAPIRSLVNVGGGVKDLVAVPMREYNKDGRIVRSIQKGAMSFAKTTSNELVKLGAKLAIGTQTVLQGTEDLLNVPGAQFAGADELDEEEEEIYKISPYADQPIGVMQGLRGGFRGLERDLVLARDAIIAVPSEAVEGGSATAAAKAVMKRTPTIVLRPAIGMTKAVGQTLLGAGNTLDPTNRRKVEDVSEVIYPLVPFQNDN